ncbi:hypothetical protein DFH09DRAFT_1331617 [Mycena vulgaris]|nr:hypothetical protein DFH09DRAFT_1331617 [Mycena vulgaris]
MSAADAAVLAAAARAVILASPNHPFDADIRSTVCVLQRDTPEFLLLRDSGQLTLVAFLQASLKRILASRGTPIILEILVEEIIRDLEAGNSNEASPLHPSGVFCAVVGALGEDIIDTGRVFRWLDECMAGILAAVVAASNTLG